MTECRIELSYRLTGDDWYEFDQTILQPTRQIRTITAMWLIMPSAVALVMGAPDWILAGTVGVSVVSACWMKFRAERLRTKILPAAYKNMARANDFYLTVSSKGILVKTSGVSPEWKFNTDLTPPTPIVFERFFEWSIFIDCIETAGIFILRYPGARMIIPKSALSSENLLTFSELLKAMVPKGEPPKPVFAS